ncbi:MAG TPA: AMIN domain-containing protein [Candidatus Acidoferrum sp.]|nr:AMIN domain-containing protein [Candidatus Acidoferrum sp.]
MMRVRQLAAVFLLVPVAAAQERAPVPVNVQSVNVSPTDGKEVHVELNVNSPGANPQVVATYHESLILDVNGAVYRGLPRRVQVKAAGVRAVRWWMQSENPPLFRIVVEFDRTEQYQITTPAGKIVLRVAPVLEGAAGSTAPNTATVTGTTGPVPAGRGSASATAVRAFEGIFRHGSGKPPVYNSSTIRNGPAGSPNPSGAQPTQTQAGNQTTTASNPATPSTESSTASTQPTPKVASNSEPAAAEPIAKPAEVRPALPESTPETKPNLTTPAQESLDQIALSGPLPLAKALPEVSLNAAVEPPTQMKVQSQPEAVPPAGQADQPAGASAANASSASTVANANPKSEAPTATTSSAEAPAVAATQPTTAVTEAATIEPASAPAKDRIIAVPIANAGIRTEFKVKFVEENTAYLDGGSSSGLAEGMKLYVSDKRAGTSVETNPSAADAVAELVVVGVAETSAVTEIHTPKRDVIPGDIAYLSSEDLQALVQKNALGATRKFPAVISFTEGGDALDEEARAVLPRPPLPSVNHTNLRIGFDYSGTQSNDASQFTSSSLGGLIQADMTRIGGTYWNLRGYWRGRLTSTSGASQQTLQDLINRTYHLSLTYENPNGRLVMGVGRLFLPWASSLQTLDGGYFGAKWGRGITTGLFGGSTPDPTSWSYAPDRHIGGVFMNEEGGSFDAIHYSSTAGVGKSFANLTYTSTTPTGTTTSSYSDNRPFLFFENSISFRRTFSIFSAVQADKPGPNPAVPAPKSGLSQSFLTVRFQPVKRFEIHMNETYFRDIPTFDPQLIGTGLLDQYLFQGLSAGVRVEVVKNLVLYSDLGRSSRSGDTKASLNEMYGITFLKLPKIGLRADAHYSRFNSSFGEGTYRAFSLSRDLNDTFHVEVLAGDQVFTSTLAGNQNARFLTTNLNTNLGAMFFMQGGITLYRGQLQNYNQWDVILGYRFDNKWKRK